jgi:hypothetical protein
MGGVKGNFKKRITLEESNIAFAWRRTCTKAVDLMLVAAGVSLARCALRTASDGDNALAITSNSQDKQTFSTRNCTIKILQLQHVSTVFGRYSGSAHQLYV